MYFWGQKYQKPPHVVFRGIARAAALHGARKIKPMRHPAADAPQPAPSFPRQTRVRIDCAANGGIDYLYMAMRSGILFTRKAIPDLVPMAKKRAEAESESGGDGLLANPRIVARRRFQASGRRHRNRSGGFCCFSPPKSREKDFSCTFGSKSTEKRERNSHAEIPLS